MGQWNTSNFSHLKIRCQFWLPNSVASDKTERCRQRILYLADLKHLFCLPSDLDSGEWSKYALRLGGVQTHLGNARAAGLLAPPCSLINPACYA